MTIDIDKLRQALGAVQPEEMEELLDRLEAAEKERDFAKVEVANLHDDIHELTDERDTYKAAHNEWLAKTEWVQDELTRGKLPAKYLGMHRADGIKVEIDALRAKIEAMEKRLRLILEEPENTMSNSKAMREMLRQARLALEKSK